MRIVHFLLKCIVGLFAAIGVLVVVAVVGLFVLWDRAEPLLIRVEPLPERAVLILDLTGGIATTRPDNPLARVSLGAVPVLREVVDALDAAAADKRVQGLFLRVGSGAMSLAQAQELRDAILDFRAAGKPTVAFAESFAPGGLGTIHYYLASAAERLWLQPTGELNMPGFRLESPFLRAALDTLGIVPRMGQRGAYKGAMNMFTDSALPAPQRANLQRLVDSALDQVARGAAAARGLDEGALRTAIDRATFGADEALAAGLVDRVGYWDEARADALGGEDDDEAMVSLAAYQARRERPEPEGPVIALIHGLGPIVSGEGENDSVFGRVTMGADTVAQALRDATADAEVRAIVFRVDSPGGSAVASDTIWREVARAGARGKPVIVSMGTVAASGGYYVAAPARAIVAQPGTITGSIGVVGGKMVLRDLWKRLGIAWDGVSAGKRAGAWSPNRDFTPTEWAAVEKSLDRVYADFTRKVAEGRDLPIARVLAVAEGRVWSGADARARGLVDALGGYRTAFDLAREAAGAEAGAPIQVRQFPRARAPIEALVETVLGGNVSSPGLRAGVRGLARLARALAPLVEAVETMTAAPTGPSLRAPVSRLGTR